MNELPATTSIFLDNYVLDHVAGDETLWITFDHAGLPKHKAENRLGWGLQELARHGWSVLAIKARAPDWFLKPDLATFFRSPEFGHVAKRKKRIILYGLSMGGFGAMAYSTRIPGSVVLAISPQTTLDPEKVPWEKRFDYALGEDWTGPLGDINALKPAHAEAYVIYCPANKFDGRHMDRLDRFAPVTHLPLVGNAHTPGGLLMEGGLLKEVVRAVAAGPIDANIFDQKHAALENSAAYHFYTACNAEDETERDREFERCLELASAQRHEFYRQRIMGFLMRVAAKDGDRFQTEHHYKNLRKCAGWRRSVTLKLMAGRYLLRVGSLDRVEALMAEIAKRHPEGHPKLAQLQQQFDEARIVADGLDDAADAALPQVANG